MKRAIPLVLLVAALAAFAAPPQAMAGGGVARLIAPPETCPGEGLETSIGEREAAMRCLVDFARRHAGLRELADSAELDRSATDKSADILRCDSFSHFACGRNFTYWMQHFGYLRSGCWRAGENIAWGSGSYGTVRSVFSAWMHSPGHRDNILSPSFEHFGVGLDIGGLDGYRNAHVWVQHFGDHC